MLVQNPYCLLNAAEADIIMLVQNLYCHSDFCRTTVVTLTCDPNADSMIAVTGEMVAFQYVSQKCTLISTTQVREQYSITNSIFPLHKSENGIPLWMVAFHHVRQRLVAFHYVCHRMGAFHYASEITGILYYLRHWNGSFPLRKSDNGSFHYTSQIMVV